jgi:hypothetical protein
MDKSFGQNICGLLIC